MKERQGFRSFDTARSLSEVQRITIAGPGGAGKTTLARQLGRLLRMPVVHLDRLYYASGWDGMDEQTWGAVQRDLTSRERWIVEGNYARPLEPRLLAADRVIFLDLPAYVCAARVVERWWSSIRAQPLDLPDGMRHRLNRKVLWYGVRLQQLPVPHAIDRLLAEWPERFVIIRTTGEIRDLMDHLKLAVPSPD